MPPLAIAAGIGAIGAIGGAALSASAQKKAASKAANSAASTAAANNALQEKIYNQNAGYLSPFVTRGNAAGDSINALLGIGGVSAAPPPAAQPPASQFPPSSTQPPPPRGGLFSLIDQNSNYGFAGNTQQPLTANAAPAAPPVSSGLTPQAAFNNYLGSTGYQFQVDQGNQAITQGYAAKNALQSGAALKALQTYGQNTATGFFKDYLGLLGNQQGVGLAGASAIAGVGSGYANSVSANNNLAGNAQQNAYLSAGQANGNLYNAIGSSIGNVAGSVFGSSYRRPGG